MMRAKGKTIAMRSKEQQDDYRFIAEPDLQAVVIDKKIVDELKENCLKCLKPS